MCITFCSESTLKYVSENNHWLEKVLQYWNIKLHFHHSIMYHKNANVIFRQFVNTFSIICLVLDMTSDKQKQVLRLDQMKQRKWKRVHVFKSFLVSSIIIQNSHICQSRDTNLQRVYSPQGKAYLCIIKHINYTLKRLEVLIWKHNKINIFYMLLRIGLWGFSHSMRSYWVE